MFTYTYSNLLFFNYLFISKNKTRILCKT